MTNLVFITLGSNIEPRDNLPKAVQKLSDHMTVRLVSKVYESAAVNAEGEIDRDAPAFLNAAVLVDTQFSAVGLKYDVLRAIESDMGRLRSSDKFAPRVIDLDIAMYNDEVISIPEREVLIPDPNITKYAFLALPLADLAPDYIEPISGRRLGTIALDFVFEQGIKETDLDLEMAVIG